MRAQIAHFAQNLDALKDTLAAMEHLLEERSLSLIKARDPLLQGYGVRASDPSTGLLNNEAFGEALERVFATDEAFTVVTFEVDRFKEIRQRFGHPVADEVLRCIGQLVHRALRVTDVAGRLDGESFALILRRIAGDRAFGVCERLRLSVQKYPWNQLYPELEVTISLGFASRDGEATAQDVLARADRFRAEAKSSGHNQTFPGMYY